MEISDPSRVQAVLNVLADGYSRKILHGAIGSAKSVEELSRENDIPLSTCYRRVNEMVAEGMLVIDRIVVTPEGKRYELLRSAFRSFSVTFDGRSVSVEAEVNEDVADKLRRIWFSMKG